LISWQLIYTGYAQWYYGASIVTMIYVALRGRIAWAWVGFCLSSAVLIAWGATTEAGVTSVLFTVAKHAPILLVGTLFALGSRRARRAIDRAAATELAAAAARASRTAAAHEREQRLDRLDHDAVPFLERIATGTEPTAAQRKEYAMLSAEFRDDLRGRRVLDAALARSIRDARERGIDVVVLDDSDRAEVDAEQLDEFRALARDVLARTESGAVTIRLLPPGRSAIGTVVADEEHGTPGHAGE
jgi:hypothetical protein